MPTRRRTFSRPCVGRDPRKGRGELPGAEQYRPLPELSAIAHTGRARKGKSQTGHSHTGYCIRMEPRGPRRS
eukprot:645119-Prymnesium_polylepis.1